MPFRLPELPYDKDALEPHISKETLEYHYGKHHQAYVNKLNDLIEGTEYDGLDLEDIMLKTGHGAIYNNAAQIWNHTFYWHCMKPNGGGEPTGSLASAIVKAFGSIGTFKEKFTTAAATQFGSGWAWLVRNEQYELEVVQTANADNPLNDDLQPLLTCDVWEHAYYIDTRNARPKYISNFWEVVNWDFVAENFDRFLKK